MLTSDGPGWCQEISARSLGAGHYGHSLRKCDENVVSVKSFDGQR